MMDDNSTDLAVAILRELGNLNQSFSRLNDGSSGKERLVPSASAGTPFGELTNPRNARIVAALRAERESLVATILSLGSLLVSRPKGRGKRPRRASRCDVAARGIAPKPKDRPQRSSKTGQIGSLQSRPTRRSNSARVSPNRQINPNGSMSRTVRRKS
jgi:hypothetical protein